MFRQSYFLFKMYEQINITIFAIEFHDDVIYWVLCMLNSFYSNYRWWFYKHIYTRQSIILNTRKEAGKIARDILLSKRARSLPPSCEKHSNFPFCFLSPWMEKSITVLALVSQVCFLTYVMNIIWHEDWPVSILPGIISKYLCGCLPTSSQSASFNFEVAEELPFR